MTPYAEAGHRSLLFGKDVHIIANKGSTSVCIESEHAVDDMLLLHREQDEMTIRSDILGTVYINGKKQDALVTIPKSATITKRTNP